tara:strand:- start:677 stop:970 length:294 start_codon:yes stop_codon:yes gene_type:complete
MNRKQRRREEKLKKKMSTEEQNLSEKISLFSQLEEECLACEKPFDKQSKTMVQSWNVVVREDQDPPVRLYCPDCWEKAQTIAKEYFENQKEKSDVSS